MVILWCFNCLWLFLTFWRLVHCWYTVGTVLVDLWRLVHQWLFLLFWLFLTVFGTLLVHGWYSLGRHVTIGTPMVILCCFNCLWLFLTFWRLVHCWYTVGTVFIDLWRLVHQIAYGFECFWRLVQCTIRRKQSESQKTVKTAKMTIGVPIVTCLHRVRRIDKATQTPLPCETSVTRAWAVATARHTWAGLTVCVYMDVHASGFRSLPRAATLYSTYWWCLQLF